MLRLFVSFQPVNSLYPVVGKSNPVGIAAEINQNRLRPCEGLLYLDNPLFLPSLSQARISVDRKSE